MFICQLFMKPHPSRAAHKNPTGKEASGANHVTPFFFRLDKLKPSAQPIKGTGLLTQAESSRGNCVEVWLRNTPI